ncbi:MAG: hypothetical protein ACLSGI_02445 [Butyricicoccaceae bacterium]
MSCDYLLGRSMARDGSAVPAERMEGTATETEHSQIVQAAALPLQVAESLESKQLSHEIESYFAVASTRCTAISTWLTRPVWMRCSARRRIASSTCAMPA